MILYLLKSMLCLLALLFVHRLLLQREVLHRFNRFYLLAAVLGSFLIPLYTIEVPLETVGPAVFEAEPVAESENVVYERFSAGEELQSVETIAEEVRVEPSFSESSFPWESVFWYAYGFVSLVFLIRFLRHLVVLLSKIRRNPHVSYRDETLVLHAENQSPFSFLKYIFISRSRFEQEGISDVVFVHEQCHVRERHSWDILLIEALLVPFWFHPGIYLARHAIRLNHEFIADQAALGTTSIQEYQQQLLHILLAKPTPSMVSSLNFSLTKKRMQMMNKKPNSPLRWLKLLVLVPVIGALVYFFGEKVEVQPEEAMMAEIQTPATESPVEEVETNIRIISDRLVEVHGESVPIEELAKWLDEIKASQPVVRFSAAPGVEMGALEDVQEILSGMEIRRVIYDGQGQAEELSDREIERQVYYRHAYILVEDENMDYTRKTYGELTEEEKKGLHGPVKIKPTGSPDPAMYEKWKDKETYAIWIDGAVTENAKLNDYTPADFGSFLQSRVMKNALSERFPQPFQVHMYTQKYYREVDPLKTLTDQDTITLTQRRTTRHKDIQKYPDRTTAYLQKNARYEKLRTSGTIYIHKSPEEKALLKRLYQELDSAYTSSSTGRRKFLKQPIAPDSDIPRNGKSAPSKDEKIAVNKVVYNPENETVYRLVNDGGLQSNALKEYLTLYGVFQTKAYENHRFSQKSPWQIEALRVDFDRLHQSYQKLSPQERSSVQRAHFPYAKIEKDGKVTYKKFEDLTEREQEELMC